MNYLNKFFVDFHNSNETIFSKRIPIPKKRKAQNFCYILINYLIKNTTYKIQQTHFHLSVILLHH